MPPHVPSTHGPESNSSSSITSSPIHSPRTNPSGSGSDSPQKDPFDLPPPAFPNSHSMSNYPLLQSAGSVPVRIPNLGSSVAKGSPLSPVPGHVPAHGSLLSASIETLHFGRKPGVVNSVISPNALLPRCACGKAAGHAKRRTSKDRGMEQGFAHLSLGPSVLSGGPSNPFAPSSSTSSTGTARVVSAPAKTSLSGHSTPRHPPTYSPTPLHTVSSTIGSSQLSRSRSDPIPPSPPGNVIAPSTRQHANLISPARERVTQQPQRSSRSRDSAPAVETDAGDRRGRGRSLERQRRERGTQAGLLNQVQEREQAPSRSRHRREERERDRKASERERERTEVYHAPISPSFVPNPKSSPISPSWSRRSSPTLDRGDRHKRISSGDQAALGSGSGSGSGQRSPIGKDDGRVGRQVDRLRVAA